MGNFQGLRSMLWQTITWSSACSITYVNHSSFLGMVYSREGTHGRMEFMAQTVQSYQGRTSLTISKSRIRLVAFSTSLPFYSTKLLEGLVASEFGAVLRFRFLSLILLETSLYWLLTGIRLIIIY